MQAVLPQRVTQHRDLLFIVIFLPRKESPQQWFNLQGRKNSGPEPCCVYLCWLTHAGQFVRVLPESPQTVEAVRIARVGLDVRSSHPSLAIASDIGAFQDVRELNQPFRMRKGQGSQ